MDAAIKTFSTSRTPGIYKKDYIIELFRRYQDEGEIEENAIRLVPMKPAWRIEQTDQFDDYDQNDDYDNDDDRPQSSNGNRIMKRTTQFMDGIGGVEFVDDREKSNRLQNKIKDLCKYKSRGFPGAQPVSMSHANLDFLAKAPYKVSWKADGTRYMMLIECENQIYLFDRDFNVFEIVDNHPKFPRRKQPDQHIIDTLLDGEMVIDVHEGTNYPRYLIYDIVTFENDDVGRMNFENRTRKIENEIMRPRDEAKRNGRINRNQELFGIRMKGFWDIENTVKIFSPKFQKTMSHEVDGLIFQPVDDPYKCKSIFCCLLWSSFLINIFFFLIQVVNVQIFSNGNHQLIIQLIFGYVL